MKVLHLLIKTAILLGVLAAGLLALASALGLEALPYRLLYDSRLGQLLAGLSAVFLVLLYWATALPDRGSRYLYLAGEGGAVNINVNAINEYLSKLDREFAGIVRLRADVLVSNRGQVDVRLDIQVRERTKVQQLFQVLQQRVREAMRDDLGIAEVRHVRVNVEKIVADEKPEPERADWQDASV